EIMVERHHAMDFRTRQVQRVGNHRNDGFRNAAERRLQGVQEREQRAGLISMLRDDLRSSFATPRFVGLHHQFQIRIVTKDLGPNDRAESIMLFRQTIWISNRWRFAPIAWGYTKTKPQHRCRDTAVSADSAYFVL